MIPNYYPSIHPSTPSATIYLGTGELEEARWFTRAEVRAMLEASLYPPPPAPPALPDGGTAAAQPPLRTPPPYAIAHHLVRRWAQEVDAKL